MVPYVVRRNTGYALNGLPGYCGDNTEAQTVTAGMANVSEVWTQKQTQEREN